MLVTEDTSPIRSSALTESFMSKIRPTLNDEFANLQSEARVTATTMYENAVGAFMYDLEKDYRPRTINEAPATSQGHIVGFTQRILPVLKRQIVKMVDIKKFVHVENMPTPTCQINYARRVFGTGASTNEIGYKTQNSAYGGTGTDAAGHDPFTAAQGGTGVDTTPANGVNDAFAIGIGFPTVTGESLGEIGGTAIDKISVRTDSVLMGVKTRKLQALYSEEAYEDALRQLNYDIITNLVETGTTQMELSIFQEVFKRMLFEAKTAPFFDFANVPADDAQVLADKNFALFHYIKKLSALMQADIRQPNIRYSIVGSPTVITRLGLISQLHLKVDTSKVGFGDVNSMYRGRLDIFDLYEDYNNVDASGNLFDYAMIVAKGPDAANSTHFYGNYVPLAISRTPYQGTNEHYITFRSRYGILTNPMASDSLPLADNTPNANKFALRIWVKNA